MASLKEMMFGTTDPAEKAINSVTDRFGTGGVAGTAYRHMFPNKYESLKTSLLEKEIQFGDKTGSLASFALAADSPEQLDELSKVYRTAFRNGTGRLSPGSPVRLVNQINKSLVGKGMGAAASVAGGLNSVSKATLGTSLGAVGLAAGAIGGATYLAGSAMGITGNQVASVASQANELMKQSARPTYGSSQMGQSVNGLVFGLNSRRTRS